MDEHIISLKDGRTVSIRPGTADDKEGILAMFSTMSEEALRWGMPPYTRDRIDRWFASPQDMIGLAAVGEGRIVGWCSIYKQPHPRRKGIGDLGIYLHQDFHGAGLGTAMTKQVLALAEEQGMHRIGLEVVEDNRIAVRLYRRAGFRVDGKLRDSYFSDDNRYHTSLIMSKILR